MSSFINHIEITNFKSIQNLKIDGLKRINLFIGKPNVGKSNILEALSVFTLPLMRSFQSILLNNLIRAESLSDLFSYGNNDKDCVVKIKDDTTYYETKIKYIHDEKEDRVSIESAYSSEKASVFFNNNYKVTFDSHFRLVSHGGTNDYIYHIKKYIFKKNIEPGNIRVSYLFPPFGENLLYVLEQQKELRETFASWFVQYGLRLVLDKASNSLKVMKDNGTDVFIIPYSLVADTLQRMIFYKTAIASNKNSVLIFEEPEAHAYPPYISEFTQDVIQSGTNQFFMATHSPMVVNDFLENAIDDLAIFMVDYKNDQTMVKALSREEIQDVYKYGVDLFFNNEAYPV